MSPSPAPTRGPEYVDIGGPIGEAGLARIMHSCGLDSDAAARAAKRERLKAEEARMTWEKKGGRGDGAIEGDAGAVGSDAVEGFGPPLV